MGFGITLARLVPGLGSLFMSLERGAPFIANLRVQWIRLSRDGSVATPPVTQLLGTIDDLVTDEDNRDVLVTREFRFVTVPQSGHATILDLTDKSTTVDGAEVGHLRAQALLSALSAGGIDERFDETEAQKELTKRTFALHAQPGTKVRQVVFLMHGIRDNGDWPRRLREEIMIIENKKGRPEKQKTYCIVSSYGHFSLIQFLLFNFRQKNVRWFMDQYTEALALSEMEEEVVHFVGHSNGTYLLAQGLQKYATLRVNRVAFIGSVVPRSFPWDQYFLDGRIMSLRNDRAEADWIVGVFPGFFQLLAQIFPVSYFADTGNAGLRGFDNSAGPNHKEYYYFKGGHGAAIQPANLRTLAEYVVDGVDRTRDDLEVQPASLTHYLSNLNWLVWVCGLGLLVFVVPFVLLTQPAMLEYYRSAGVDGIHVQVAYFLLLLGVISTV